MMVMVKGPVVMILILMSCHNNNNDEEEKVASRKQWCGCGCNIWPSLPPWSNNAMQNNAIIFTILEIASINAMQVKAVQLSQSDSFRNCPAKFLQWPPGKVKRKTKLNTVHLIILSFTINESAFESGWRHPPFNIVGPPWVLSLPGSQCLPSCQLGKGKLSLNSSSHSDCQLMIGSMGDVV